MKKRTLISVLREQNRLRNLQEGQLELVNGGQRTITQDENGKVIIVDTDKPET